MKKAAQKATARKLTRDERIRIRTTYMRITEHVGEITKLTLAIAAAIDGILDPEILAKVTTTEKGPVMSAAASLAVYERTAESLLEFLTKEAKALGVDA